MSDLRDFINQSRNCAAPLKKRRAGWTEHEMSIALDLRLTQAEAAQKIGCSRKTVNKERSEWVFEWKS